MYHCHKCKKLCQKHNNKYIPHPECKCSNGKPMKCSPKFRPRKKYSSKGIDIDTWRKIPKSGIKVKATRVTSTNPKGIRVKATRVRFNKARVKKNKKKKKSKKISLFRRRQWRPQNRSYKKRRSGIRSRRKKSKK